MHIGVPKEIKPGEGRVALIPESIRILIERGNAVFIEYGAGELSGFPNSAYKKMGAQMSTQSDVWKKSHLIVKVKEPLPPEYKFLRPDLKLMAFFHFAANTDLQDECIRKKVKTIPYELIETGDGKKPILREMSLVAGEIAADMAGQYLRTEYGGEGILLQDATVIILGALGNVGGRACEILEKRAHKVLGLDTRIPYPRIKNVGSCVRFFPSGYFEIKDALVESDVVICAAVNQSGGAPHLITRKMLRLMKRGSVFIDVAIDEGGGSETSHPTTYARPAYIEEGVVHICVANLPGGVPRSSSRKFDRILFPYVLRVADGEDVLIK